VDFSGDFLNIKMPIIEIKDNATGKLLRKKKTGRTQEERGKPEKKNLKRKREKSDPKPQKKKEKEFINNSQALKLIEKINSVEDKKREEKLNKEEGRNAHLAAKTKEKEDRKLKKEKIRLKALAEVKKIIPQRNFLPNQKGNPRNLKEGFHLVTLSKLFPKKKKTRKNKQKNPKISQNKPQRGQQKKK